MHIAQPYSTQPRSTQAHRTQPRSTQPHSAHAQHQAGSKTAGIAARMQGAMKATLAFASSRSITFHVCCVPNAQAQCCGLQGVRAICQPTCPEHDCANSQVVVLPHWLDLAYLPRGSRQTLAASMITAHCSSSEV